MLPDIFVDDAKEVKSPDADEGGNVNVEALTVSSTGNTVVETAAFISDVK